MKLGWEIQKNTYLSRTWESEKRERMGWRHGDGARASWEILVFYWAPLNSAVSSKPASSECYLGKKNHSKILCKNKGIFHLILFFPIQLCLRDTHPVPGFLLHSSDCTRGEIILNLRGYGQWSTTCKKISFFFHPASQIHSEHLLENCGNSRQLTTRDAKIYR